MAGMKTTKISIKNENMVKALITLNAIKKSDEKQTGLLGLAIAINAQKLETEVKPYLDIRNGVTQKIMEEIPINNNDTQKEKQEKEIERQKKIDDGLKDIAWVDMEIDVAQIPLEDFCGGTLDSVQMGDLLWMIDGYHMAGNTDTLDKPEKKKKGAK